MGLSHLFGHVMPGLSTQIQLRLHESNKSRRLEIGPGGKRTPGFETLDVVGGSAVDYVCDASGRLPFADDTFELVYASHVLEHIPWYQTAEVLREWARILRHEGRLEVWVPDGLKICKAFVDAERNGENRIDADGWYRFNAEKDPCKWAAGRLFTYGDGKGTPDHPNWHRALFSPRYLARLLDQIGLRDVHRLEPGEVRGTDHGWINLGMAGTK